MTAFPNLKLKTLPGMDPIMQFQETESVPEGDLGIARVDVSVSRPSGWPSILAGLARLQNCDSTTTILRRF